MNYNRVTIISILVTAIFVMPLFSFAAEETVPGAPFQALQEQIDELWQHINNMPTGEVKAYSGKQIMNFPPLYLNQPANVITLDLPKGNYISTTTVNAAYFGGPWMETSEYTGWTYSA